jgi:hypothetical protein
MFCISKYSMNASDRKKRLQLSAASVGLMVVHVVSSTLKVILNV